jgi:hypothetical protein
VAWPRDQLPQMTVKQLQSHVAKSITSMSIIASIQSSPFDFALEAVSNRLNQVKSVGAD